MLQGLKWLVKVLCTPSGLLRCCYDSGTGRGDYHITGAIMRGAKPHCFLVVGRLCLLLLFGAGASVAVADTPIECLIVMKSEPEHPELGPYLVPRLEVSEPLLYIRNASSSGSFTEQLSRGFVSVSSTRYLSFQQVPQGVLPIQDQVSGTLHWSSYAPFAASFSYQSSIKEFYLKREPGQLYGKLEVCYFLLQDYGLIGTYQFNPLPNAATAVYVCGWIEAAYSSYSPPGGADCYLVGRGSSYGITSSAGVPYLGLDGWEYDVYFISASVGLTREMLSQLPWGWWADRRNFIVGNGNERFLVSGFSGINLVDNPNFPPPIPTNPYTGRPYLPGEFYWTYDVSQGKWVHHNRYLDPTSPPTTPLGSNGQWRYGRRPGGNLINTNPEGLEWYWDGTIDNNSPGIVDGGYSSPTGGGGVSSTAALNLLQQIANNTGQTLTQSMGISTAIQGLRTDEQQFHNQYMTFMAEGRASLFNMLHNHHAQVEMDLSSLVSSVGGISSTLGGMSSILGDIRGNTASIDNKMSTVNNNLTTANDFLSSIKSSSTSIDNKMTTANTQLVLINGELQTQTQSLEQMRSLVANAVGSSERLEGHLIDIKAYCGSGVNQLDACREYLGGLVRNFEEATYNTEQFRNDFARQLFQEMNRFGEWRDELMDTVYGDRAEEAARFYQSFECLQKIVDVTDSMEKYFTGTWDPAQDALWWRVERLRWVERGEQDTENLAQINEKMSDLISEVAAIPPPEIPQVDLSEIENQLQQLVEKAVPQPDLTGIENKLSQIAENTAEHGEGPGVDLSGIEDALEVIKQRLQSIDRSVSSQMDVPAKGTVELDNVQKGFANGANQIKGFYDEMSALDSLSFGFNSAWLGRPGNPVWWEYQLDFLGMEADLSIDLRDDKWNWFTRFLPLIKTLEKFCIWILVLIGCFKFAVKVNG